MNVKHPVGLTTMNNYYAGKARPEIPAMRWRKAELHVKQMLAKNEVSAEVEMHKHRV